MIKGCTNPECNSNKKKKHYKEKEYMFCPECGRPLAHVCKDCSTVLTDDSKKYCVRCEQQRKDKRDRVMDSTKRIGGAAFGVAATIPGVMKFVKK